MNRMYYNISFVLIMLFLYNCGNAARDNKQNHTQNRTEDEKLIYQLIHNARDSIDCSKYKEYYKPYVCLGLDSQTIDEVRSIYGKEDHITIDTLEFGKYSTGYYKGISFIDEEHSRLPKCLLQVSFAKITSCHWFLPNREILFLFFIEYHQKDVLFDGYLGHLDHLIE